MSLREDGTPALLLEILELDGGWLTTDGVLLEVNREVDPRSATRALARLRSRGLVASRPRRFNEPGMTVNEWRAA